MARKAYERVLRGEQWDRETPTMLQHDVVLECSTEKIWKSIRTCSSRSSCQSYIEHTSQVLEARTKRTPEQYIEWSDWTKRRVALPTRFSDSGDTMLHFYGYHCFASSKTVHAYMQLNNHALSRYWTVVFWHNVRQCKVCTLRGVRMALIKSYPAVLQEIHVYRFLIQSHRCHI